MSRTTTLTSAKGNNQANEPLTAIRKRPKLYKTIISTPPASSDLADIPVPAPAPNIEIPYLFIHVQTACCCVKGG